MENPLPAIPAKRYFTIGEVSELCAVKPYVLRYWEQEFTQLRPMKRRGNRRYYQHHEVLLVRRIRELLYGQGFTINGARGQLAGATRESGEGGTAGSIEASDRRQDASALSGRFAVSAEAPEGAPAPRPASGFMALPVLASAPDATPGDVSHDVGAPEPLSAEQVRAELLMIRALLAV